MNIHIRFETPADYRTVETVLLVTFVLRFIPVCIKQQAINGRVSELAAMRYVYMLIAVIFKINSFAMDSACAALMQFVIWKESVNLCVRDLASLN